MSSDFKLFMRQDCPFCTKVLVFLAEAKLLGEVSLEIVKSRQQLEDLKEQAKVDAAQIPCLEVKGSSEKQFVFESDEIVQFLKENFGIKDEALMVFGMFKDGMLKDYLGMQQQLGSIAKTAVASNDKQKKISEACAWFKLLDQDGDGNVDLDELLDGLSATRFLAEARRGYKIKFNNSKWTDAVEQIEQLLREAPKFVEAWRLKMVLGTISDDYEMLFEAADKVIELKPGDPQALLLKAVYSKSLGDQATYDDSLDALKSSAPKIANAAENLVSEVNEFWEKEISESVPKGVGDNLSILALGSPANEDGTPQPRLLGTLEKTLQAAELYPDAPIFVTGAAVSTSMPEAIAMKNWLVGKGVEKERIIMEMKARDTVGNYVNIAPFLEERKVKKVMLITVRYHLNRSSILADAVFKQEGLSEVEIVPVAGKSDLSGEDFSSRMVTERAASYRDLARAWNLYDAQDFLTQCHLSAMYSRK